MSPNVPIKRRGVVRLPAPKPDFAPPPKPASTGGSRDLPSECWRISRVAKALDVTPKRVYRLISEGKLEAVRLGPRCLRVFRRAVEECLADLARQAAENRD